MIFTQATINGHNEILSPLFYFDEKPNQCALD